MVDAWSNTELLSTWVPVVTGMINCEMFSVYLFGNSGGLLFLSLFLEISSGSFELRSIGLTSCIVCSIIDALCFVQKYTVGRPMMNILAPHVVL